MLLYLPKQKSLKTSFIYLSEKILCVVFSQYSFVDWCYFSIPYNIFFYTQLAFIFHLLGDFYVVRLRMMAFFLLFFSKIFIPFTRLFLKNFLCFYNIWLPNIQRVLYTRNFFFKKRNVKKDFFIVILLSLFYVAYLNQLL